MKDVHFCPFTLSKKNFSEENDLYILSNILIAIQDLWDNVKKCAKIASPLLKNVIGLELVSLAACVDAEYI